MENRRMIFQLYKTIEDINGTGINGILEATAEAVPIFPGLILAAVFIVLASASFYITQRRVGKGDLPASCVVAGFVATVIGLLMSMIPNFINNRTIVIVIAIELIFVVWLFFSSRRD